MNNTDNKNLNFQFNQIYPCNSALFVSKFQNEKQFCKNIPKKFYQKDWFFLLIVALGLFAVLSILMYITPFLI